MRPEERLATLKELVKIKNPTIDERRRAQALLRSLQNDKGVERKYIYSQGAKHSTTKRHLLSIGRAVLSDTMKLRRDKTPVTSVDFLGQGTGTSDKPFKGGLKDSKLKALQYQLGQAFIDVPDSSRVQIHSVDDRRSKAYNRFTGGALQFENFPKETGFRGGEARAWVRPDGRWQPTTSGKFGKALPNPAQRLQQPLRDAAASPTPSIRRLAGPAISRILGVHGGPYVQGAMAIFDLVDMVTDGGASKQAERMIKDPKAFFNYEALPKPPTLIMR